jgi:hypothetical protein
MNGRVESRACRPFCVLWLFQFEQSLRNVDDQQNSHQQSIAQATVVYYCSRMEAVSLVPCETFRLHRVPMLSHMSRLGRKVTKASPNICFGTSPVCYLQCSAECGPHAHLIIPENNVERLAHLSARDVCSFQFHLMSVTLRSRPCSHQRELLATKVLEIGRSHLNGGARDRDKKIDTRAEEAVIWLQKAFSLVEHLDDTLTAGAVELKVGSRFYRIVWLIVGRLRPQRCILRNLGLLGRLVPTFFHLTFRLVVLTPARAYVLSSGLNPENLARAETALNELLDSIPPDDVSVHQPRVIVVPDVFSSTRT